MSRARTSLANRLKRSGSHFATSTYGASLVETAVLIVAILALAALAAGLAGAHAQGFFRNVARKVDGTASLESASRESKEGYEGRNALDRSGDYEAVLSERNLMLVAIVLLAMSAWLLSRRGKAPEKQQDEPTSSDVVTREPEAVFEKRQQILRVLSNRIDALFEGRIAVSHLMTRNPTAIRSTQETREASALMDASGVDYLVVCDKNDKLVGLLSRFYLQRTNARTISEAMARQPLCVSPDALLNPTVTQMISRKVSCVVVLAEGRPVGLMTTTDVQLTMQCALQLLHKYTSEKEVGLARSVAQVANNAV